MGLVLRPLFPEPPGATVVAAFRAFVRETGSPEAWPFISTDRPPEGGEVLMLAQGVSLNIGLRPNKDLAPCPICRPRSQKWKNDGSLIWCGATSALYCIGPDCSRGELRRKINVARNVLAQTEREQREVAALVEAVRRAPHLRAWAAQHRKLAAAATARHRQFASALPKLRSLLSRQLRQGLPPDIFSGSDPAALKRGRTFLTGGWNLERDLDQAEAYLGSLTLGVGEDVETWAASFADSARTSRLELATEATRLLRRVEERLTSASAFLSAASFEILRRLGRHPSALAAFEMTWVGSSATIQHREEFWRGSVSATPPVPLSEF